MQRFTDVVDAESIFYISDDILDNQASTINFPDSSEVLVPGRGIMAIRTPFEYGLARVSVEIHDAEPAPSEEQWDEMSVSAYRTDMGSQRIRSSEFEECQGELAQTLTPPGEYMVHLRAHWRISPQPASELGVPVSALYLLQLWMTE